jgi:glucokinase
VEWFARFYGRACRLYALHTLALGGVYITGGMALRLPVLTHPAFAEEFRHSAAHRPLLEKIPVWHVRKPQAGLWGAALYGLLRRSRP